MEVQRASRPDSPLRDRTAHRSEPAKARAAEYSDAGLPKGGRQMKEPTPRDIELADCANRHGASSTFPVGDGTRTEAERRVILRAAADAQLRAYHRAEQAQKPRMSKFGHPEI